MDCLRAEEFISKLRLILVKIKENDNSDGIYTDIFFNCLNTEFSNGCDRTLIASEFHKVLSETLQEWRQRDPSVSESVFFCQFFGFLSKNEHTLYLVQNFDIINEMCKILQPLVLEKEALKPVFIKFLSDFLNHPKGYEIIKAAKQWKSVSSIYLSNTNLYVEREGLNFFKKLFSKAEEQLIEEILQELFLPFKNYNTTDLENKNFCSKTVLLLKLLESLLKTSILSADYPNLSSKLIEVLNFQTFLNFLLNNCKQETIIVAGSIVQILFIIIKCENKTELLSSGDIQDVWEVFYFLIKENQFYGILKVAKYCQILWGEMRQKFKCENKAGVYFIIMQLLPVLISLKPLNTALCDLYIQKLFSLTTIQSQKFFYLLRDEIRSKVSSKPKHLALKGVLSVISNTECLNLEEAVIIFQAMAHTLKTFIPDNVGLENCIDNERFNKEESLCIQDTSILSAVLNALCVFIEKFKINWTESLESLCLLKITCVLLENSNLSSIVVVQVFLLVKLVIINFMSPDLALLLNNTKDSTFDCLMPLIYKRLHDPNWEIRDSCLEVLIAIAELSESKYPAFQQLLIEKNFYSLIVDVMEKDSESYVRASAVQALTAMTKIEAVKLFLNEEFVGKIIKLLRSESEGIVRREAALLITQIYLNLSESDGEVVDSLYEIMGYLAICDLHWEVKINSLYFWESVIQRTMADQGMIDGSFPKVTFSKEHKKIINLTKNEVKIRLDKVLVRLSNIGCLHVLLSTLNDDCDMPVIKKSAQILSDLITILKSYEVMGYCQDVPIQDRVSMKRKSPVFDNCEKRKATSCIKTISEEPTKQEDDTSDKVIDGIVNEMDINLLVSVSSPEEKTISLQKKIVLQKIKPEIFILQMQNFDLEKFLAEKQKWLVSTELDLNSITNETNSQGESIAMDCY